MNKFEYIYIIKLFILNSLKYIFSIFKGNITKYLLHNNRPILMLIFTNTIDQYLKKYIQIFILK